MDPIEYVHILPTVVGNILDREYLSGYINILNLRGKHVRCFRR